MKKKKSKKKIIIGAAAVLVVAGGVTVAGQRNSTENQIPQVQVVIAEKGDVEEIVDATGTVGSEEEKTYYSPVNAELKTVSFAQGDVVKKGTKLIEFNTEDLEKDNRKAELNLKSTKYDTKDTRNKSDKAEKKQKDAKKNVQELEKKIKDKKAYVSSLKSQISAAATAAQREAAAQAIIGAAAVLVVAGGVTVAGQRNSTENQIPQVQVVIAEKGDVEEIVDATGTVGSEEEKTYYSPVNAELKTVSFAQGDVVKKGTKLIEFNTEDLEKDNRKAELNLKSTKYDTKDTRNKSDKAEKKQKDAKKNVQELEKKIKDKKAYVSSLKSQISAAATAAQREAAAQASAQAAAQAQAQQQEAQAKAQAEAKKQEEIQSKYQAALYTYKTETLPQYQQQLSDLNAQYNQAQSDYNQADTTYQMAFATWQADPSDENTQALDNAETARTQAQLAMQQAQQTYNDLKQQTPKMPVLSDFTESSADYSWGISDGSDADDSDGEDSSSYGYDYSGSDGGTVTADTSALESALETASDELAELQSDLASEKAIAEADSTSLTKEEKEKLKVTDNLSELDAKSAEELVKEGKKGITAEFNGIISKADIKQGAAVTQGMELFTIENTDKASVDVTLSKYDYNTVKEGQSVEITLGDNTYQGTVTKMSHIAVQNEKGTPVISATVSIDNPDEDIFLGVDAKVKIYAASAKNVVTLPVEVVNIGKEGSFCYVIEDGLVTKRNITTGISSEDYVEITDGIKEGEEVIADLGDYTEGMEVQAVPEQTGEDADE